MLPLDMVSYALFATITVTVTLYFMLLTRLKQSSEIKLSTYLEEDVRKKTVQKKKKTTAASKVAKAVELPIKNGATEKECPHYVGYLTMLPKGTPFPDECFGCRKVIQCLRLEPTKAIESFYMSPTE